MEMTNPFLVPSHSQSGKSGRLSSTIITIIIHWKIKENNIIQLHLQGRPPLGSTLSWTKLVCHGLHIWNREQVSL